MKLRSLDHLSSRSGSSESNDTMLDSFAKKYYKDFVNSSREILFRTLLLLIIGQPVSTWAQDENAVDEVFQALEAAPDLDKEKWQHIDSLRKLLNNTRESDLKKRYSLNRLLFEAYQVFKQDSAFNHGIQARNLAKELDSHLLLAESNLNLAKVNISAGMYKEGLEFLESIDPKTIPANTRSDYYALIGRYYNELADYSNLSYYSKRYNRLGVKYRKLALSLAKEGTFQALFLEGVIKYDKRELVDALAVLKPLLERNLNYRQTAWVNSVLGYTYEELGQREKAITHFSKAAVADISSSTKETVATTALAKLLYKKGQTQEASIFIQKALEDAEFFGAQQRKLAIGAILPLIEEQIIGQIQDQKQRLYRQNIIMTFLLVFLVGLAFAIYLQVKKLKKAKKIISHGHEQLQEINKQVLLVNEQVEDKNLELNDLNNQLWEANKIKEEYIGLFFMHDAKIFEKFKEFKNRIEKELAEENVEKLKFSVKNLDLKREKEKLLKNFDEAFIKLFPNFVEEFNSLLKPEEKIKLKKGQFLNKELRIFALMRLGIKQHEIIAQILGFNVNSVYTYKTKVRRKSFLESKDFDQKLAEKTTLRP